MDTPNTSAISATVKSMTESQREELFWELHSLYADRKLFLLKSLQETFPELSSKQVHDMVTASMANSYNYTKELLENLL